MMADGVYTFFKDGLRLDGRRKDELRPWNMVVIRLWRRSTGQEKSTPVICTM